MASANQTRVRIIAGACLILGLLLGFATARFLQRPASATVVALPKESQATETKSHSSDESRRKIPEEAPDVPAAISTMEQLRKLAKGRPLDLESALRLVRGLSLAECQEAMDLFQRASDN